LFSQESLARQISEEFEPVWQSVRPAPQVTIDFGEGRVVRRTLHGNVMTWICDGEGRALDAIPGVCTADVYRARLAEARLLATYIARKRPEQREAAFRDYHERQTDRIAEGKLPLVLEERAHGFASKMAIERPLEMVLRAPDEPSRRAEIAERGGLANSIPGATPVVAAAPLAPAPGSEKIDATSLDADTKLNESIRRRTLHEMFAATGSVPPAELTKRAYRDVLGVDLDDPWLGLGDLLHGAYPFEK
jgi:hypothetical protein